MHQLYRRTYLETANEAQICRLTAQIDQLRMTLKTYFPHISLPADNFSDTCISFREASRAIVEGYGPRFVAKYNLASADEERASLLKDIPCSEPVHADVDQYLTQTTPADYERVQAWAQFVDSLPDSEVTTVDSLDKYVQSLPSDRSLKPPAMLRCRVRKNPWQGGDGDVSIDNIVILPIPLITGYVALGIRKWCQESDVYSFYIAGTVRWSYCEDQWVLLDGVYMPADTFAQAMNQLTRSIGIAELTIVHTSELEDLAVQAQAVFRDRDLPQLNYTKHQSMTITTPYGAKIYTDAECFVKDWYRSGTAAIFTVLGTTNKSEVSRVIGYATKGNDPGTLTLTLDERIDGRWLNNMQYRDRAIVRDALQDYIQGNCEYKFEFVPGTTNS